MFRHGIEEIARFTITEDQIFENRLPDNHITYICYRCTGKPVINTFFVSGDSIDRFLQQNPLIKERIGKDYIVKILSHSHNDQRATISP